MRLRLPDLVEQHPKLAWSAIDYATMASCAFCRSGHSSPTVGSAVHEGIGSAVTIEWDTVVPLDVLDEHRVTEDGAEAVALSYVHALGGWRVKRRLQRGEHADWLLMASDQYLALEVSGTVAGDVNGRLLDKTLQVSRCTIKVTKLAVIVRFEDAKIVCGCP